ncbi:hypothetical protein LINPERHAP2_LOCUS3623 [Linum perenne]
MSKQNSSPPEVRSGCGGTVMLFLVLVLKIESSGKSNSCSDGGFVTRCSPQRISHLKGKISADKIARLKSYGFGGTLKVSITQILFEFRRWLMDIYDVPIKTFILAPDMSLSITEEDVQDVYGLPKGDEVIYLANPGPCRKLMTSLTTALGLKFSKEGKWNVDLKDLKTRLLGKCPILDNWCQLLKRMKDYNWCKHVLDHLHQGMVKAKSGKYIESDLHLVIDTKKAKKELRAIQGKRPDVMNEESPLVKPLFGPSIKIDFTGMSNVQVAEMEKWILSIRDKCNSNLARLHNLKRDNVRQGKRTEVADIQSSDDDSERTESVSLNDVPTSAEEENSLKVASKGPPAGGQSSSGHKSKDSPVDDGPTVSEIAAQTIQSLHEDDDDDFDNEALQNLRRRKMDGTVHTNVKKPCLKFGMYAKIVEEAIHSHSWIKEYGDLSSCDYWMFPILHADHYSMFIINIKDKRYQFFDSRSTAGFKEQWLITGARIIKHVTEYLIVHKKDMDYTGFEWEMLDGIRQRHWSTDCGDYVMRIFEKWEGKHNSWIGKKWKDAEEVKGFREVSFLDMFTNPMNKRLTAVLETGTVHYTVSPSQLPTPRG